MKQRTRAIIAGALFAAMAAQAFGQVSNNSFWIGGTGFWTTQA